MEEKLQLANISLIPYKRIFLQSSLSLVEINKQFQDIVEWQKAKINPLMPWRGWFYSFEYQPNAFKTGWTFLFRLRLLVEARLEVSSSNIIEVIIRYPRIVYASRIVGYIAFISIIISLLGWEGTLSPDGLLWPIVIFLIGWYILEIAMFNVGLFLITKKLRAFLL